MERRPIHEILGTLETENESAGYCGHRVGPGATVDQRARADGARAELVAILKEAANIIHRLAISDPDRCMAELVFADYLDTATVMEEREDA